MNVALKSWLAVGSGVLIIAGCGGGGGGSSDISSFTKLDASGNVLANSAASWNCIRDNTTGLVWENKTDTGDLHDKDNTYTNYQIGSVGYVNANNAASFAAATNVEGLCGRNNWRLPSAIELQSIVDYSIPQPGPTINVSIFPNTNNLTSGPYRYWTSSVVNTTDGRIVGFGEGWIGFWTLSDTAAVRLVSGEPAQQTGRFSISSDGTEVTDNVTRLTWRRCVEGMHWDGSNCSGTGATFNHVGATQHAASQANSAKLWRLPDIKELTSIVDYTHYNPVIDSLTFPNIPTNEKYWSSTLVAGNEANHAWKVDFQTGGVYYWTGREIIGSYVRLVRNAN